MPVLTTETMYSRRCIVRVKNKIMRSIINSFVDAGNDLVSAEDVYQALHYGNRMKDTSVCVLQIDEDNTQLSGEKIKNVSNYHSVCYHSLLFGYPPVHQIRSIYMVSRRCRRNSSYCLLFHF